MNTQQDWQHQRDDRTPKNSNQFSNEKGRISDLMLKFFAHYGQAMSKDIKPTVSYTLDTLIKRPGEISFAILESKSTPARFHMIFIFTLCALAYGAIMGSFSGGLQWMATPVRLSAGWILSALICLPSLHVLCALSGGRQSIADAAGVLLQSMTLQAIIMLAFSPVVWLFSQSTNGTFFMGALHLSAWSIGAKFALSIVNNAFHAYNGQNKFLFIWSMVYVLVALQMSTTLRPFIGEFDGWELQERVFFIKHWLTEMSR